MKLFTYLLIALTLGSCSTSNNINDILRGPSSISERKQKELHRLHVRKTSNKPNNINSDKCVKSQFGLHDICEGDIYEGTTSSRMYVKSDRVYVKSISVRKEIYDKNLQRYFKEHFGRSPINVTGGRVSVVYVDGGVTDIPGEVLLKKKIGNITDQDQGLPLRISIVKENCLKVGACYVMKIYKNHSITPSATWLVDIGPSARKKKYARKRKINKNFKAKGPVQFFDVRYGSKEGERIIEEAIMTAEDQDFTGLMIFKAKRPVKGKYIESEYGIRLAPKHYEQLEEWIKTSAPLSNSSIDFNI